MSRFAAPVVDGSSFVIESHILRHLIAATDIFSIGPISQRRISQFVRVPFDRSVYGGVKKDVGLR